MVRPGVGFLISRPTLQRSDVHNMFSEVGVVAFEGVLFSLKLLSHE